MGYNELTYGFLALIRGILGITGAGASLEAVEGLKALFFTYIGAEARLNRGAVAIELVCTIIG